FVEEQANRLAESLLQPGWPGQVQHDRRLIGFNIPVLIGDIARGKSMRVEPLPHRLKLSFLVGPADTAGNFMLACGLNCDRSEIKPTEVAVQQRRQVTVCLLSEEFASSR